MNNTDSSKLGFLPPLIAPPEAYYPSVPVLNLELSNRCNLKCPYCSNRTLARPRLSMSDAMINRIIDEAESRGYTIAWFHGTGEPLLREDLEQIFSRLRARGLWPGTLTTNGTLMSEDRARSLAEAGLTNVFFSVDTLDPELYRRTRGGDVHRVISNIQAAARVNPQWTIWVGLMNHREQRVGGATKAIFERHFGAFPKVGLQVYENGRLPGAAEDWTIRSSLNPDGPLKADQCAHPAQYLTIAADGRASICCADQNVECSIGDVNSQSIYEIWYSKENQDTFRNIGLGVGSCPEVCTRCVLKAPKRGLEAVAPIFYAPLPALVQAVEAQLAIGSLDQAMELSEHAFKRDPYSKPILDLLARVEKRIGRKSMNYDRRYLERSLTIDWLFQ